jgi:hypothetical protein
VLLTHEASKKPRMNSGRMNRATRRTIVIMAAALLTVPIAVGGFFGAMRLHFHLSAPTPHYPPAANALDAQRQDLDYFRQLIAMDRSFPPAGRSEANRRLDAIEASGTVLDAPHFRVLLMQIDALADNGHSRVEREPQAAPSELPVRVVGFSDGLYVMRATTSNADLLGGRVTAIDGQSIDAVMSKLERLRGGTTDWRRLHASQYLRLQDILFGIDVAPDMQHSNWTIEAPDGATITKRLDAYIPSTTEPAVPAERWLSSEPLAGMGESWRVFQPDRPQPISLTDFDRAFRSLRLAGSCSQFVQLKSNVDQGGQRIKDFLSTTERELRQAPPCNVIFDLRYDGGGDYMNTERFAHELPKLIPEAGRVILLTGPATFSAGISTAVLVKHAGGDRAVIIGEPVGDRLQFYSEGGQACLPHHPLCVAYQTGKHDYQHPCTDWTVCFWLNYFFDLRVKSLRPDELIPLSFKDWRAGVDPVLDGAMRLAAARER